MNKNIFYYICVGVVFLFIAGILTFFFFRSTSQQSGPSVTNFFGVGGNVSVTPAGNDTGGNGVIPNSSQGKVFKIANGPVAGATFVETFSPTTTLARYVMADNGHILDQAIDVPGAASKPVSNTTIPSVVDALWGNAGTTTILQYMDSGTLKSVYLALATTSSTGAPLRVQFLPNNISSLALSPDARSVVYMLTTNAGSDGYTANIDGTNPRKLFSSPLSQVLISWPATSTLMLQSKSAAGVPGAAFVIDAKLGTQTPLLFANGLVALANSVFSKVVYQTAQDTDNTATTYSHDIATGKDAPLANDPLPEKCVWSPTIRTDLYCALPIDYVTGGYVDLWHKGLVQTADSIVLFKTNIGDGIVLTLPGEGGANAPIEQLGVSQDGKYLWFITRGDQSLWGVRL